MYAYSSLRRLEFAFLYLLKCHIRGVPLGRFWNSSQQYFLWAIDVNFFNQVIKSIRFSNLPGLHVAARGSQPIGLIIRWCNFSWAQSRGKQCCHGWQLSEYFEIYILNSAAANWNFFLNNILKLNLRIKVYQYFEGSICYNKFFRMDKFQKRPYKNITITRKDRSVFF